MNSIPPGTQQSQKFEKKITTTVSCNYLLFLPEDYGKKRQSWPLMVFLHGAGERGSDLNKVKVHGPPKIVENRKDFPFIVVSPQCPEGD
ncbi:MAG: phospholipase, partial [Clostridia bacterium]|nr:phospholipase [Clostridia bacterium]